MSTSDLAYHAKGWHLDCEIRQHSLRTIEARKSILEKLYWFLEAEGHTQCGKLELRKFLAYCGNGHTRSEGRWGNPRMTKPVRPRTVHTYHGHLRTFFGWLVNEGILDSSPMECIAAPVARQDQIQPFTDSQVHSILAAAKRSIHPKRNEAVVLVLLDTGIRASELCQLTLADVDLQARRLVILGKGNKHRSVFFSGPTAKALWNYLREDQREPYARSFSLIGELVQVSHLHGRVYCS